MSAFAYIEFENQELPFIKCLKALAKHSSGKNDPVFQTKECWIPLGDTFVITWNGKIVWKRKISLTETTYTTLDLPSKDVFRIYTSLYLSDSKAYIWTDIYITIENKRIVKFSWESIGPKQVDDFMLRRGECSVW